MSTGAVPREAWPAWAKALRVTSVKRGPQEVGSDLFAVCSACSRACQRTSATPHQTTSTTPNGHAPWRKPYSADARHASAKASTKRGDRGSSAYATSIVVTATAP